MLDVKQGAGSDWSSILEKLKPRQISELTACETEVLKVFFDFGGMTPIFFNGFNDATFSKRLKWAKKTSNTSHLPSGANCSHRE